MERLVTSLFLEEDLQLALVLSECSPTTLKIKSNISHLSPPPHPHLPPLPSGAGGTGGVHAVWGGGGRGVWVPLPQLHRDAERAVAEGWWALQRCRVRWGAAPHQLPVRSSAQVPLSQNTGEMTVLVILHLCLSRRGGAGFWKKVLYRLSCNVLCRQVRLCFKSCMPISVFCGSFKLWCAPWLLWVSHYSKRGKYFRRGFLLFSWLWKNNMC